MTSQIGLLAAFGAGVISFLSPCVLPLLPGYLSFLGGASVGSGEDDASTRRALLVQAALFVAGFTLVFVVLGVTASALGAFLVPYRAMLSRVAGVVVFVFGFFLLGVIKVPWLYREARVDLAKTRSLGRWSAPVMGAAFGFGWTPCVGPILAAILTMAAQSASVASGALLLLAYSLGLGVPFLLAAVALGTIKPLLRFLNRHARAFSVFAGVVLMIMGVVMATGQLERVTALLS